MKTALLILLSFLIQADSSFKSELDNYLKKNLTGYKGYEYEILQMPGSYKKIELLEPEEFNLSGNLIYIPVKLIAKSGRTVKSILTVRLKLYKNVLAAAKQIGRREKLSANDFKLKKVDAAQIKGTPLSSLSEIGSLRSKTIIKQGEVVIKEMLEPVPVINIGDPVNAKYVSGNVIVSFEAFSRQEGIAGETITVITKDKKQFKAKVIDSNNVNIIE